MDLVKNLDEKIITFLDSYALTLLRVSLAVVFIWFGLLKILHITPVYDLVAQTIYWFPPDFFVPFLGYWEVAVGLGLLFKLFPRTTLFFFVMQMSGTFLVLVFHPDLAFQNNNPFMLTTIGEFVIKNLVLLTAGLVVGNQLVKQQK